MSRCQWQPVVAVPVRNEAERLPILLAALAGQSWLREQGKELLVCLVLNNCEDASRAVCEKSRAAYPELDFRIVDVVWPSAEAHVGRARRLAMDTSIAAASERNVVVLTTDADAQPHSDWIAANLRAIAAGADAVGGLIIGDASEEALLGTGFMRIAADQARYAQLVDRLASIVDPIRHDPWPRHQDHTGASLAVRADVYKAIGGLPPLPFREDLALVSNLKARGFKIVHPLDVRVGVSARLNGRARGGMADCLKGWVNDAAEHRPHLVERPATTLARLQHQSLLRLVRADAAQRIERLAADELDAPGVVPIADAIYQIESMLAQREVLTHAA